MEEDINGVIQSYVLVYKGHEETNTVMIMGNTTNTTIFKLSFYTKYTLELAAITVDASPLSILTQRTDQVGGL